MRDYNIFARHSNNVKETKSERERLFLDRLQVCYVPVGPVRWCIYTIVSPPLRIRIRESYVRTFEAYESQDFFFISTLMRK